MVSASSLCRLYELVSEAAKPRRGVSPSFREWHVLAYMLLAREGPLGSPLASRILGRGDTAVKTMIRRLRELGAVETLGVAGTTLRRVYRELLDSMGLCVSRSRCVGLDCCIDTCDLRFVLALRDSMIGVGVQPRLILCCRGGVFEAPGAPRDIIEEYVELCSACSGERRVCVVLEGEASVLDVAKVVVAAARVVCGANRSS